VPLDRRHEQKLWDAFRAPIDEAFNRKTAEREKASAAMSETPTDDIPAHRYDARLGSISIAFATKRRAGSLTVNMQACTATTRRSVERRRSSDRSILHDSPLTFQRDCASDH